MPKYALCLLCLLLVGYAEAIELPSAVEELMAEPSSFLWVQISETHIMIGLWKNIGSSLDK